MCVKLSKNSNVGNLGKSLTLLLQWTSGRQNHAILKSWARNFSLHFIPFLDSVTAMTALVKCEERHNFTAPKVSAPEDETKGSYSASMFHAYGAMKLGRRTFFSSQERCPLTSPSASQGRSRPQSTLLHRQLPHQHTLSLNDVSHLGSFLRGKEG